MSANDEVATIVDLNPLTDFVIEGKDIRSLKKRAEQFIAFVGNLFTPEQGSLTLSTIKTAARQIRESADVREIWTRIEDYNFEGIIYTIKRKDGSYGYISCLNEKIVDLLGDDPNKPIRLRKPKDSECAKAYWRALKSVYLHEIGHLLLNRKSSSMWVSYAQTPKDPGFISVCKRIHDLYSQARIPDEADCDLLSFVLAFWPIKQFTKSVMSVLSDWNNGNIRIQIADKFNMSVNPTVQWMCILFYDKLGMHYIRREEQHKKILDRLDYSNNICCFYNNDVFSIGGTAAARAATSQSDEKSLYSPDEKYTPFLCAAFYDRKELFCNKPADEIVVVGFMTDKVKEEVNIFTSGVG